MRHTLILFTISLVLSNSATTAVSAQVQTTRMDLATLYDLGNLVVDTNADSVPDLVNASLILGATPSISAVSYTHLRAHET